MHRTLLRRHDTDRGAGRNRERNVRSSFELIKTIL